MHRHSADRGLINYLFISAISFLLLALWTLPASAMMAFSKPKVSNGKTCVGFYESSRGKLLHGNEFQVSRDLVDYFVRFGTRFQRLIKELGADDLWVDLGAGHAYAQKDWLTFHSGNSFGLATDWQRQSSTQFSLIHHWWPHYKPKPEAVPQMTSISFIKPDEYAELTHPRFQYKEMDLSAASLDMALSGRKARVMTDYFGNLSYTETFSEDLKKYITQLQDGGSIFISIDNQANTIKTKNGTIPIVTWLKQQQGLLVNEIWMKEKIDSRPDLQEEGLFWDGDSIEIKVSDLNAFLNTPNLKLKDYVSDGRGQPTRVFEEGP